MPGTMPAGPFGCTCGAYMHEEEYYDSSDGEPGESSHRYVRENYHAHEEAARRSEVLIVSVAAGRLCAAGCVAWFCVVAGRMRM